MRLTVLGSGTLAPHPARSPAGVLLEIAGERLLIDCGSGTYHRAHRLGVELAGVRRILFTHHHPDHTLDFGHFLFAARYVPPVRTEELEVIGGPGTRAFVDRFLALYGDWIRPAAYPLVVTELSPGDSLARGWRAETFSVRHAESSLAYRFEAAGKVLALTGDSDVAPGLAEAGRGADLLVLECSNPDGAKVEGHLTPTEAGEIAAAAGAKRLLLTHRYPTCDGHDIAAAAAIVYGGEIHLAEDGSRIEI